MYKICWNLKEKEWNPSVYLHSIMGTLLNLTKMFTEINLNKSWDLDSMILIFMFWLEIFDASINWIEVINIELK